MPVFLWRDFIAISFKLSIIISYIDLLLWQFRWSGSNFTLRLNHSHFGHTKKKKKKKIVCFCIFVLIQIMCNCYTDMDKVVGRMEKRVSNVIYCSSSMVRFHKRVLEGGRSWLHLLFMKQGWKNSMCVRIVHECGDLGDIICFFILNTANCCACVIFKTKTIAFMEIV